MRKLRRISCYAKSEPYLRDVNVIFTSTSSSSLPRMAISRSSLKRPSCLFRMRERSERGTPATFAALLVDRSELTLVENADYLPSDDSVHLLQLSSGLLKVPVKA